MRTKIAIVTLALVAAATLPAMAELQNVQVGGEIHIRGNYINDNFTPGLAPEARWAGPAIAGRPLGDPFGAIVGSIFSYDDRGGALKFVEQRTRLNVRADFTDEVSAFIEIDSYDIWGETPGPLGATSTDFRSNYITGADARAASTDDIEIFQAYIEANNMFDMPLRLRVGRQELAFGTEWLVGTGDFEFFFTGLSFDAIRLTYCVDTFSVDAWWSKLAETSPAEEDGDIDFYGVYGSYKGLENVSLDAYWMLVRDARQVANQGTNTLIGDWLEGVLDLDEYDPTYLNTVGLRGAGKWGALDASLEVAYQFGNADRVGSTFIPVIYGDDDADYDSFGAELDVGYTFDVKGQPRVFLMAAYLGGDDDRDVGLLETLTGLRNADASISFNRLFSDRIYSGTFDLNNELSNAWLARVGVMGGITEKLGGVFMVQYFESLDEFDAPWHITVPTLGGIGMARIPLLPGLPWLTTDNDDELGWETDIFLQYRYSEDLMFEAGWAHTFVGDGLEEGNYSRWNGLLFNGGSDDDDVDYVYLGTKIKF